MRDEVIEIDLPKNDVYLLLASLKIAEIQNGDAQQWKVAKRVGNLHTSIQKQIFYYEGHQ